MTRVERDAFRAVVEKTPTASEPTDSVAAIQSMRQMAGGA